MAGRYKKRSEGEPKTLTPRQKRLVENLANPKTESVSQAALDAGYSPSTATSLIYALVRAPHIQSAVQRRMKRALAHAHVTPEEVIGRTAENMRTSIDDCLDKDGRFDVKKARRTGAIDYLKKVKVTTRTVQSGDDPPAVIEQTEFELLSPADARKELANYMGLVKTVDNSQNALLQDFKRLSSRIIEEAILQNTSERDMAELFLSDPRTAQMDPEIIRLLQDRFLQ